MGLERLTDKLFSKNLNTCTVQMKICSLENVVVRLMWGQGPAWCNDLRLTNFSEVWIRYNISTVNIFYANLFCLHLKSEWCRYYDIIQLIEFPICKCVTSQITMACQVKWQALLSRWSLVRVMCFTVFRIDLSEIWIFWLFIPPVWELADHIAFAMLLLKGLNADLYLKANLVHNTLMVV